MPPVVITCISMGRRAFCSLAGERLSLQGTLGLVLAVNDIFLVQLRTTKIIGRNTSATPP